MVLKLNPIFLTKIWGGTKISLLYNEKKHNIGECWGISGHSSYSNIIINGEFEGRTLRELFTKERQLFGNYPSNEFPILVKYIDAIENLSIQVHPNDSYAKKAENSLGKEECWYILDTNIDTDIIIGHSANSIEEIKNNINQKSLLEVVNHYKIKPNDYFYIPSGTIHAICSGTFLIEVSQSSNITYRLYDYERLDNGRKRELHIDKSLDVINIPDNKVITTHKNKYFSIEIIENETFTKMKSHKYGDYISILLGQGYINEYKVKAGDFYMVSSNEEYIVKGKIKYHRSRLI